MIGFYFGRKQNYLYFYTVKKPLKNRAIDCQPDKTVVYKDYLFF